VARVDPGVPVKDLRTLSDTFNRNVFVDRTVTTLAVAFAVIAATLAALGLYGVIAHSMSRRTRELGLRLALGSTAGGLRLLVLGQLGRIALIGSLIGLGGSIGLGRVAQSMLFGLSGLSLSAAVAAALGLCVIVAGAGYLPTRRVMQVDPMAALRGN